MTPNRMYRNRCAGWITMLAAILICPVVSGEDDAKGEQHRANRLAGESSPYLLQHAYNPVDWYPWGPEAIIAARQQNKPIFLSIGYSTCYWCHVMERESFENERTAKLMNELFICIKIDREERPDLDDVYMAAVQSMAGRGGWPMSLFIDPRTLSPYAGGTYFPPTPQRGRASFTQVMRESSDLWQNNPEDAFRLAQRNAERVIARLARSTPPQAIGQAQIDKGVAAMMRGYDAKHGGFRKRGPKFPLPSSLQLILEGGWADDDIRSALLHTLDAMALGGIYDQVGGGFHRYSTDTKWLVPHFEKMLYDNAQLASIYAQAADRTGNTFYRQIVRETLDYVLREMTDPAGGFYSAQDAEVDAREGKSYIWRKQEVIDCLTAAGLQDDVTFALQLYGLNRGTNFRDPHHRSDPPGNVLFMQQTPDAAAQRHGMPRDVFDRRVATIDAALLATRDLREQPGTDDKILVSWNGLMIKALADGARTLDDDRYTQAAERAAAFLLDNLRTDDGGIHRTWRKGEARIGGFLEDYAMLAQGLLALHRQTDNQRWLDAAVEIVAAAKERFWNSLKNGYYNTEADQRYMFVRTIATRDGVVPCGNSTMIHNLLDLYEITESGAYLDDATAALKSISGQVRSGPQSTALSTVALSRFVSKYPGRFGSKGVVTRARPIRISTDTTVVTVTAGTPASVEVTLDIAAGYHINAHEPGKVELVGLEVRVVGGKGVKATVTYPEGEMYRGEIRIHRGKLKIPVTLERSGERTGNPKLMVVYQVCTDRECLPSDGRVLPIRLNVE